MCRQHPAIIESISVPEDINSILCYNLTVNMTGVPQISVLIPLYKGQVTIKACLDSLLAQTGVDIEILLLDNGCPDDTGEWAGYHLAQQTSAPTWKIIEVPNNVGFAAGNNILYAESKFPLILFLNQDVELAPDHLSILADALSRNTDWGGVTGTLFRKTDDESKLVIDTSGHIIFRDRIVRNRGAGKVIDDKNLIPWQESEVFGVSCACALFKKEALIDASESYGPFDSFFFAYFEDVDLDYRMHRAGYKLGYTPDAVGAHVLAGSGGRKELYVRLRAYGNRRRIMFKHENLKSLLPDLLPILIQDLYGWGRALFTDPVACIAGPWFFWLTLGNVLDRRNSYNKRWGSDMSWVRKWLRPQVERFNRE